jgi:hypothetical protein
MNPITDISQRKKPLLYTSTGKAKTGFLEKGSGFFLKKAKIVLKALDKNLIIHYFTENNRNARR